uniref:Shadow of prion protein n=1 Tax=Ursus americanus TaxID=9643 RepID=A0A452RMX6_URSAM
MEAPREDRRHPGGGSSRHPGPCARIRPFVASRSPAPAAQPRGRGRGGAWRGGGAGGNRPLGPGLRGRGLHCTVTAARLRAAREARTSCSGSAPDARSGLAAGSSWRKAPGPGERDLEDDEDAAVGGNRTGQGVYSYRAWTSGAGPTSSPRLCLLLGGALGALGLLRP